MLDRLVSHQAIQLYSLTDRSLVLLAKGLPMQEPPLIAGAGGGVGTTTIATALRGRDCDIYQPQQPVHVLVCRSTMHSLGCAQRALQTVPDDLPRRFRTVLMQFFYAAACPFLHSSSVSRGDRYPRPECSLCELYQNSM